MTSRSYFGKMNSILGSVVPLAMFEDLVVPRPMKYKQCALIGDAFDGVWQTLVANSRHPDKRLTNPGNLAGA